MYIPPFTITDEITSLIADIAEKVGHLSATADNLPAPHLRKENRIKTIQSSLAIENNSLSIDQVTAILEGNGRVGRLVMFKECLRSGVVPFIITDELKMFYYRGLREWGHIDGYLTDTCLTAQDNYKAVLDYFRIKY